MHQAAERADDRQEHEPERHAAATPERVGDDAEDHAERHAGELHQRQQEAGLHQRQAERVAQHRDRGRQLADVQRRDDAGEDHDQRRVEAARGSGGMRASIANDGPTTKVPKFDLYDLSITSGGITMRLCPHR